MPKAISTVIATLLMLIITIALVGFSYTFVSGVFTVKTSRAFSVSDAYQDTVTIRNDGTDTISFFSSVTVDGNPATISSIDTSATENTYYLTGSKSWWKFDEGMGTTASDSSGNGHTATLDPRTQWPSTMVKRDLLL